MKDKEIKLDNLFLLENIQGGIVYSDLEPPFRLRFCTEGMAELSGYSIEELMDMYQMDLVFEDDIESLSAEVGRQLTFGDTFSVEYRLKKKDGSFVYVLDKAKAVLHDDGKRYIHCLLTDISDLKIMEQALLLSQEKYKLALKQSGNVILEIDLQTNCLAVSENYERVFNDIAPTGSIFDIANNWLEKDFIPQFFGLIELVVKNKSTESMELKIRERNGTYVWGLLHLTAVKNARGIPYAIVGSLKNVEKEKQHLSILTERSEKDGLTGIYNRAYMEEKVNAFAEHNTCKGALLILDIDNFKAINDTNGHAFGDDVLKNLVSVVNNAISVGAIFGRLGGDEFLIFIPEIDQKENLLDFLNNLINSITVANEKHTVLTPITLSVGAAIMSNKNDDFTSLYKRADKALYHTKEKGRNGFTIA